MQTQKGISHLASDFNNTTESIYFALIIGVRFAKINIIIGQF